ncbi:MAG: methyltransferase, partial [Mariprofundaceae bacterium]
SDMYQRRRLRWQVGRDEEGSFLGFFAPLSHRPIRQRTCMAITEPLQALHDLLERQDLNGLDQVQAVQLADGIHVVFESGQAPSLKLPETLDKLAVQGWWRSEGVSRPLTRPVKRLHDVLPAGDGGAVELEIGPDAFVQGQFEGNHALIAQIQAWAGKPRRVADLFCGAGNLSLPLAVATGASVFGAELSQASVNAASRNAKLLGVNGSFVRANLFEDFAYEPYIGADVLILDAPRRGAKRICSRIQQLMPKKIIMVSCDIAAGARDGSLLAGHGYRLQALRALDMFSYAGHVEAISLWEAE